MSYKKSNEKDNLVESKNQQNSVSRKKNEVQEGIDKTSESIKLLQLQKKIYIQVKMQMYNISKDFLMHSFCYHLDI